MSCWTHSGMLSLVCTRMARPECPPSENIVRALTTAYWDPVGERYQSHLFSADGDTSVSRLAILSLPELFEIFRARLEKSWKDPPILLLGAGEINIGEMQALGLAHTTPIALTVEEDPETDAEPHNPAHAEIPQGIPRKLSKKIITALQLRSLP